MVFIDFFLRGWGCFGVGFVGVLGDAVLFLSWVLGLGLGYCFGLLVSGVYMFFGEFFLGIVIICVVYGCYVYG